MCFLNFTSNKTTIKVSKTKNSITNKIEWTISNIKSLQDLINTISNIREKEKKEGIESKKINIIEELDFQGIECKKNIYIPYCEFQKSINFRGAKFHDKVRFHHCIFKDEVCFENATFYDLIDFYDATFENAQQFYRVDFKKVVVFSNTKFRGETQFLYCTTDPNNTYLNFESAEFDKYVDISRSNFNNNLNFWNVKIGENLDLSNTEYYKDSFGIHKNDTPDAHTLIRESYRRIKKSFADNGNKIAESEFAGREQNIYLKELIYDLMNNINAPCYITIFLVLMLILSTISSLTLIILLLVIISLYKGNSTLMLFSNKISNNFGRNWILGVIFTLVVGIITFVLLIQTSDYDSKEKITDYIPDFIKVFNVLDIKPFDSDNDMFKNKQFEFYLILIIGRIFIGYGYYQTIQAFRKYGKS